MFHYSPKTGKAAPCSAKKRACRYGQHFKTMSDAEKFADQAKIKSLQTSINSPKKQSQPIIVVPTELRYPDASAIASYDFDFRSEPDGEETDYGRNSRYNEIWLTMEPYPKYLEYVFGTNINNIPKHIQDKAKDENWHDPENFELHVEPGYYGEEAWVTATPELQDKIAQTYFDLPNAVDYTGALAYCRGKGLDTTGQYPQMALKELAKSEGHTNPILNRIRHDSSLSTSRVPLDKITLSKTVMNKTVATQAKAVIPGEKAFDGVLVKRQGTYHLIDGYKRVKYRASKSKTGSFLIIDLDAPGKRLMF